MYILCDEGDTDSLYAELDKKTSIPLIPEFKDYILDECFKRKILISLEVLYANVHFDAYMLEVRNDEKEIEQIVNDGLKTGCIVIPNAVKGTGFKNIETVSQYLNKYGILDSKPVVEKQVKIIEKNGLSVVAELENGTRETLILNNSVALVVGDSGIVECKGSIIIKFKKL